MRYGKLVNGVFVEAPKNLKLPDGRVICNFNSNIDIMDEHGFKPVKEDMVEFNQATETLIIDSFVDNDDHVLITYKKAAKPHALAYRVESLEENDINLVATSWDMDYRICEIEWALEDSRNIAVAQTINLRIKGESTMALSRYEQAKIMILGGAYVRETLERQLTTYLRRGYLTQEEYDELIALMDARELVTEEK
ncbi:MAG: hypothetical protein ACLTC1_08980 [Turicibacter sp.]